jgi:dimethylamine monooxygenase subunit A
MIVLQRAIPAAQVEAAGLRLPSMTPVGAGEWLRVDEAYGAQLAEKARLIGEKRADVIAMLPGVEAAVAELLDVVLAEVAGMPGFVVRADTVTRPDGMVVAVDRGDPLLTLSRIVQEDFCIHEKRGAEHVLTAALLCFPAAWTLAEKIGRPLTTIHAPVARYDADVATRVQRMFDMVRADRPLWRANLLRYDDPSLFQPHTEANPRPVGRPESPYRRSERQTIRRLPRTDAVVFSIHTTVCVANG